jgi:hypothetical protein
MILIENTEVIGFQAAIRGMRNPLNSWDKSDSGICKGGDDGIGCEHCAAKHYPDAAGHQCNHSYDHSFQVGVEDYRLMMKLTGGGPVHAKYRRFITVYHDITAPLYWWKEFDTYRVGVCPNPTDIEMNSCSTMHKIMEHEFTLDDFSHDHLTIQSEKLMFDIIGHLNAHRMMYLRTNTDVTANFTKLSDDCCERMKKDIWWQIIQLLPTSYNQKRTIKLNYEVLANAHAMRKNHKLDEWREYCRWIESLPCSKVITD